MGRCLRDLACLWAIALVCLLGGPHAVAGEEVDAAHAAYDRATRAYEAGDFATAAREYARADELAPHATALRWAIDASTKANDAVLAMTLAARAARAPEDPDLAAVASAARDQFAGRVGSLILSCEAQRCEGLVDGSPGALGEARFVTPGKHQVEFRAGKERERRWVDVNATDRVEVQSTLAIAPAPPPRPGEVPTAPEESDGISPLWLLVGAGVTAALGGVLIWSGIDTLEKHDRYLETRDQAGFDAGQSAELRTNILIGATAGAAAVTVLVAIFAVDF